MNVKEIMTRNPECCAEETKLQEVARMMVEQDCGEVPICKDGKPIGAVTDRDITVRTVALRRNPLEMKAGDCMTTPCITVGEDAAIEECISTMQEHQIRRIPVVDARGICTGIVSQADIAERGSRQMTAELVQEVSAG